MVNGDNFVFSQFIKRQSFFRRLTGEVERQMLGRYFTMVTVIVIIESNCTKFNSYSEFPQAIVFKPGGLMGHKKESNQETIKASCRPSKFI